MANTVGLVNTAIGVQALNNNTSGNFNTALGTDALGFNSSGSSNIALGGSALGSTSTGSSNIALGQNAGFNPTASSNSIFIGNQGLAGDTSTIKIGTQGTQTTAFIAAIRGVTTAANDAIPVLISSTGQLGTISSSLRYKENIAPMAEASAALHKLRPVTFRYKKPHDDGRKPIQYGLIAEEVAEVLPDLAVFNHDGSPETVKYHLLPSLLLNEVQGQQRTIERQEQTIRSQAEQIAAQADEIATLRQQMQRIEAMLARGGTAAAGSTGAVSLVHAAP
jgi:hypothetical protein